MAGTRADLVHESCRPPTAVWPQRCCRGPWAPRRGPAHPHRSAALPRVTPRPAPRRFRLRLLEPAEGASASHTLQTKCLLFSCDDGRRPPNAPRSLLGGREWTAEDTGVLVEHAWAPGALPTHGPRAQRRVLPPLRAAGAGPGDSPGVSPVPPAPPAARPSLRPARVRPAPRLLRTSERVRDAPQAGAMLINQKGGVCRVPTDDRRPPGGHGSTAASGRHHSSPSRGRMSESRSWETRRLRAAAQRRGTSCPRPRWVSDTGPRPP